ncbi:MAG: hypothetical protein KAS38_18185 [Anaerolineales bacterium]|nr:hypothetical protein [Anaerolineales bacterium]
MRVGANVRQFHRIKKMHKEGYPADVIANSIPMTPQSLEKILAHLDGRKEVTLAVEENAEVQALRLQVAEQAQKLAKYEDPQDGEEVQHSETEEVEAEKAVEGGEEVAAQEEVATDEVT